MLMAIRDRFTGVLAWAIVIIISVPFVFWGIQEYLGLGRSNFALIVNGSEVSNQDYSRNYEFNRRSLQQRFGGKIPPYLNEAELLQKQTMDGLVQKELLLHAADEIGLRIGNTELAENIISMPAFQTDGKFDQGVYESQLQAIGSSKSAFESDLRDDLLMTQISKGISSTAFITQQQLADYVKVQYQSRDIQYALIKADSFEKDVNITEDAIKTYYDENLKEFVSQEQLSLEYIELNLENLKGAVEVNEEGLLKQYNEAVEAGGYSLAESRDSSHILIRVPEDSNDETVAEKRKAAEAIKARLDAGESFASLAKDLSEDPGSAEEGGSLGTVERGVMVKPFEDALYALSKEGEISQAVQSNFGFHIIKLDKINAEQKTPFEEVRDRIEEDYRQELAEKQFYELSTSLGNLVFENETSLKPASDETGLAIQATSLFSRAVGVGLASHAQVRNAAFSEDVLQKKYNSDLIEIAEGHVVAIRLKEHKPSVQSSLEDSRAVIQNKLKTQALDEKMAAAADAFVEAAKKEGMSESLAKQYKSELVVLEGLKRDNRETPYEIVTEAFKLQKPNAESSELTVSKARLRDGSAYAVIVVNAINNGDLAWVENEQKSQANRQLETAVASTEFDALISSLKADANILINAELEKPQP